ncbi:MAG: COX15/CtaA family protein [Burkholderiales bacterium]|nr:MAG: COX15/CtaA family protein [Burkholderiales bacterium]
MWWQFSIDPVQLVVWLVPLLALLYAVVWRASYRSWVTWTAVLTLALLMLGAYVRLTDAGLGCPVWPGCYRQLTPLQASSDIQAAEQAAPQGPVTMPKAWKEMVHRYLATVVGAMIVGLLIRAWLARVRGAGRHVARMYAGDEGAGGGDDWRVNGARDAWLLLILLAVVILQGLFGKWTVTLLLKPAIVTGHLIGGMLVFALLVWLWQRQQPDTRLVDPEPLAVLAAPALIGVLLVAAQVALGGWVSTNYAALACTDFPLCQGRLIPEMNFGDAFHVLRELGMTGEGELLPLTALTAMHWTHRVMAVLLLAYLLWLGARSARAGERPLAALLLAVLGVQWLLGISNVLMSLPLAIAVMHNGGAALLLALVLLLYFRALRARLRV